MISASRSSDGAAAFGVTARQVYVAGMALASLLAVLFAAWGLLQALLLPFTALDDGLRWAPRTGLLLAVAPGSAAESAGLRPGDRVAALERDQAHAGATITLLRGDLTLVRALSPLTPSVGVLLKRFMPIGVAIVIPLIGFLVWAHKPYDLTVALFLLGCLLCATGVTAERMLLLHPRTAWLASLHAAAIAALAAVVIHGHMRVTEYRPAIDERSLVMALYGIAATLAVAAMPPAVTQTDSALIADGARIYAVVALAVAAVLLALRYRASRSALIRRSFAPILVFTGATVVILIGGTVVPDIVLGRPLLPVETSYLALGCIPLAYGLAVFRHDLLSVGRVINRRVAHSLAYLLAGALVFLTGVLLFIAWPKWLTNPLAASVAAIGLAGALVALCVWARSGVDELLYGGWYDAPLLLDRVSRSLDGASEPAALARALATQLAPMRLREITLLLADAHGVLVSSDRETGDVGLPLDSSLAAHLAIAARPLTTGELDAETDGRSLGEADVRCLAWARRSGVEVWAPLVRDGALRGALLAGGRSDGEPCTIEDRRLLGAVAQHVAAVAEGVVGLARLRERLAEAEQLRQPLETMVAERTHALAKARDELERVVLARGREVSAAVHDLLHDLKNAQLLQQTLLAAAEQRGVDSQLVDGIGRQLATINAAHEALLHDMLASVLIQEGQLVLHPSVTDLARLVSQVAERLQPRYTSQRCLLTVEMCGPIPPAWCDERQMGRVLHNLLVNALEYTSPVAACGVVRVRLAATDDQVTLAITDNGAGIEPTALAELRAVCDGTAHGQIRPHGMGIGLRFAARLVALSGGRLSIESAGRQQGTTVTIALPQARDERARDEGI